MTRDTAVQWDHAVRLFEARLGPPEGIAPLWCVVRFRRNTHLFLAGDVALGWFMNGDGERLAVFGKSSRGREVSWLMVQFARFLYRPRQHSDFRRGERGEVGARRYEQHVNKAIVEIVEDPWTVTGVDRPWPSSAAVRRYVVETLRAGGAALPRGTRDSGGP